MTDPVLLSRRRLLRETFHERWHLHRQDNSKLRASPEFGEMTQRRAYEAPFAHAKSSVAPFRGVSSVLGEVTQRAIQGSERSEMPLVSVACAITLTGWSESTFRRRFADGTLKRVMEKGGAGRVMVTWASLRPYLAVDWSEAELPQLLAADLGDPAAQREVGLVLLAGGYAKGARQWLIVAAKRNDPEAAYWLCRLHLAGAGVEPDPAAAVRWLAEAARLGHTIAQAQISALSGSGGKIG